MELREIGPEQWHQLNRSIVSLAVCAGLGLCGALTVLSLHVLVPAVETGGEGGAIPSLRWVRWALWPTLVLALTGAVVALVLGLSLAIDAIASIYPRFLI